MNVVRHIARQIAALDAYITAHGGAVAPKEVTVPEAPANRHARRADAKQRGISWQAYRLRFPVKR